jgi:hypothetical protein
MSHNNYPPSVEVARLFERTSARGLRYMSGLLGLARVTLLPGEPTEDGTATWRLLVGARPDAGRTRADEPQRRPAAPRPASRPRSAAPPIRPDSVAPADDSVDDLWPES